MSPWQLSEVTIRSRASKSIALPRSERAARMHPPQPRAIWFASGVFQRRISHWAISSEDGYRASIILSLALSRTALIVTGFTPAAFITSMNSPQVRTGLPSTPWMKSPARNPIL